MVFGEVFKESWKEYKGNFKTNSKSMLLFYFLPLLILGVLGYVLFFSSGLPQDAKEIVIFAISLNETSSNDTAVIQELGGQIGSLVGRVLSILIPVMLLGIVAFFLGLFGQLCVFAASIKKKKFSFREAMKEARKNYLSFVGLFLLVMLVMIGIMLASVILGIITLGLGFLIGFAVLLWIMISWTFASYVLVDKNEGVGKALGDSWRIVKGKWWRTIGSVLLLAVFTGLVSYLVSIIELIFRNLIFESLNDVGSLDITNVNLFVETLLSKGYVTFSAVFQLLNSLLQALLIIPIWFIFFKNLYLDYKRDKKEENSVKKKKR